jgi:cytochrome c-type biogenesis protein CcmH
MKGRGQTEPTRWVRLSARSQGRWCGLALSILLAPLPAHAVQPNEVLKDPALEHRAREISEGLRCLVCQNQSIDDSDAPLAKDLRLLVRDRLEKGDTNQGVRDYIVARYGEFVLLRPVFAAHTLLLWLTPVLAVLLGAFGLWRLARRRTPAPVRRLSPTEEAEVAALLRRE